MPITAVVFDFDGVLADTERLHLRAFQEALAPHGRTLDERAYYDRFLGYSDRDLLVALSAETGWVLDESGVSSIMALKAKRFEHLLEAGEALFATAGACVRALADRYLLGIASGSLHGEIEHILVAAGLRDPFRVVVGADDVAASKPAPDPYLKATELLGVDPASAVAVEDSHWGLESARAAGLRTIAVATTYPPSALGAADLILASLDDLSADAIDRL